MKRDLIFRHLLVILLEREHVALPGLGLFLLKSYPARIDPGEGKIYPPGQAVEFLEAPGVSDYFVAYYLSTKISGDFGFWQSRLEDIASEVNELKVGEALSMEGLGTFGRSTKSLNFTPDSSSPMNLLKQLPPLSCVPVPSIKASSADVGKVDSPTTQKPVTETTKGQSRVAGRKKPSRRTSWTFWLLLVLTAGLLFGLIYFFGNEQPPDEEFEIPPHIADQRLNQKPDQYFVDTFELDTFEEGGKDAPIYRDFNDHDLEEEEYERSEEEEEEIVPPPPAETPDEEEPEEPENNNGINSSKEIPDRPHSADKGEKCIIVTGSFSRMRNVSQMTDLLQELGYAVYTENLGQMTRVGAVIECDGDQLETHLMNLKANVEPASWVLE
jgi:cell division septation protein DedD